MFLGFYIILVICLAMRVKGYINFLDTFHLKEVDGVEDKLRGMRTNYNFLFFIFIRILSGSQIQNIDPGIMWFESLDSWKANGEELKSKYLELWRTAENESIEPSWYNERGIQVKYGEEVLKTKARKSMIWWILFPIVMIDSEDDLISITTDINRGGFFYSHKCNTFISWN